MTVSTGAEDRIRAIGEKGTGGGEEDRIFKKNLLPIGAVQP